MFFKKNQSSRLLDPTIELFDTIIGQSTQIHGRIVTDVALRVDGVVIGDIEAERDKNITVAIGHSGKVEGDIKAYRVFIAGHVVGNVYASERVELHKNAVVDGDVTFGQLGVENGAKITGLMLSREGKKPVGPVDHSMLVINTAKK